MKERKDELFVYNITGKKQKEIGNYSATSSLRTI